MGFYDTPDYDYNSQAAREANARAAEQRAAYEADQRFQHEKYNSPTIGGDDGGDWHIDAICVHLGFTNDEANVIKSQYDCALQGFFGGNTLENTPQQYESGRTPVREGDPLGLFGFLFRLARQMYFSLENVPVVNDLRLWAAIDRVVLSRSTNRIVQSYLEAIKQGFSPRIAH
jgi:hypothetical protein